MPPRRKPSLLHQLLLGNTAPGAVRVRDLRGLSADALAAQVAAAVPERLHPLFDEIFAQADEYEARQPRQLPSGATYQHLHGFSEWMGGLLDGWAALPWAIPESWLLAWRNGYANHPARSTPVPHWRCEDCRMAMPNCTADGALYWSPPCPVCGGDDIRYMDLAHYGTFPAHHRHRG